MSGLIVICGATATGKSQLAIAVAQRLGSVILSADSRQVYREFDIGTAKPSLEQQRQVPHYFIDSCDPRETFTMGQYQRQAQRQIAQQHQSCPESPPLLVGGTGLYIKSITRGLRMPAISPQPELRSQLQTLGQGQCYQLLQQVDEPASQRIHPNDASRTLRALEVYYVSGHPLSEQQGEQPPEYPILHLGLHADPDLLRDRIARRTRQMVEMGLVEEVNALCDRYGDDLPLLQTLGYAEMGGYRRGEMSLEEAIAQTTLHTCQFAKRQRTWFRAYPEIEWFDVKDRHLSERVLTRIQQWRHTWSC
ncbi:MAG: tRNA (adenosine(37)-N6)-dimethylallyltransferase MiaA [Phormidium sp. GEM2.Bin31]|nr:MAG: tRNA (adenosine(37)-N6)-dimethylallyltransferase MiaA [Phormidium sp. GEM2.Bin31]